MSDTGKRIKALRKAQSLTLAEVAQHKMSSAMLSMIENGKSNPSAENLKHIAKVLRVNIDELMGEVSREKLQEEIDQLDISKSKLDDNNIKQALTKLHQLLPKLDSNVESATIYELYGNYLYFYYKFYKPQFNSLEDNNWELYFKKAAAIYADLQMESKVLGIDYKLAEIEFSKGNYQKTIDQIDHRLQSVQSLKSLDAISHMIGLKMLKANCLEALGNVEATFSLLHDVIHFSNKHLMLNDFYMIHNFAAMLYYQNNDFETARKYVDKINSFFKIVDNTSLYLEKEIIMAHYIEFFENKPEESLKMIDSLEKFCQKVTLPNKVIDNRKSDMVSDMRARCYTKLQQPERALSLFRDLMEGYHVELHPMDIALRVVNHSYKALCYMQLHDKENAIMCAWEGVNLLEKYPRTAYYLFAKNTQRNIQQRMYFYDDIF